MDKSSLISKSLISIRDTCLSLRDVFEISQATDLLILEENGSYTVYAHELPDYIEEHFHVQMTRDKIFQLLPDVAQNLDMHVQPMKQIPDLSVCDWKILLM